MPARLNLLRRHQQTMLEIVGLTRPLILGSARDVDLIALKYLRREMVETLARYCALVAELEAAGGPAAARNGALHFDCLAMQASYDDFRRRWAHREAVDHWAEYRLSALHMIKRLRDYVLNSSDLLTTIAA